MYYSNQRLGVYECHSELVTQSVNQQHGTSQFRTYVRTYDRRGQGDIVPSFNGM